MTDILTPGLSPIVGSLLAFALAAWPATAAEKAADAPPKIVVGFLMNGTVLRGGRIADEVRLKADLATLKRGDTVLACLQAMNDKVSDAMTRVIISNAGQFDVKLFTKGVCPPDPATEGRRT